MTDPAWDETALLLRARTGDTAAFEALVTHHAPRVWRLLVRLVGPDDAPDVVQQTFLAAWQSLDRFRPGQPFWPWLSTIASNRGLNCLRGRKRSRQQSMEEAHERLPDPSLGPEGVAARQETARLVQAAVQDLPATAATIVNLHYGEGLTCGDIGKVLGMQESAVKVALFRARQRLRDWLTRRLAGKDGSLDAM